MPSYYLVECIEEALEVNQKHAIKARRSLEDRCKKDHRLLLEMVEEFLPSIIGKQLQAFLPQGTELFGKKKKTAELSETQLQNVVDQLNDEVNDEQVPATPKNVKPMQWAHAKKVGKVFKFNKPSKNAAEDMVARLLEEKSKMSKKG